MPVPPPPHPSGATPPVLPPERIPRHVAIVMDGNGRWANERGLPRTAGHAAGEAALLDVVAGAIEIGVTHVSAYADCHGMKFEVRISPLVRRKRSTSGRSGSSRNRATVFSVTFSGSSRPAATSRAIARAASAISARPP